MLHAEIREAVRSQLVQMHGLPPDNVLRDELGLCLGATRVDVASINGQLTGCEIKGDRDRLDRLPHQVQLYGQVLDAAVLVTGERFASKAADHLPDWWGIWRVTPDVAGGTDLTQLRAAGANPNPDALSVAQLLWREETYDELLARDAAAGLARATRWRLWEALATLLPLPELSAVVRARLKVRRAW